MDENKSNEQIFLKDTIYVSDISKKNIRAPINSNEETEEVTYKLRARKTVTVELNRYGVLYKYPGNKLLAKTHSKTQRVGIFERNYERKCECCNSNLPSKYYTINHHMTSGELMKYGIDLTNFFILIKKNYFFILYFYVSYLLQLSICLLLYGVPDTPFNFLYFELYYQHIIYEGENGIMIDNLFNLIRIALIFVVYSSIIKKMKSTFKKYNNMLYNEIYVDESLYSLFVKNLPKKIDPEDFKNFLIQEYKVDSIIQIKFLKITERVVDLYQKLESSNHVKKRMDVTNHDLRYNVNEFKEVENIIKELNYKLKECIDTCIKSVSTNGTAIVIFEKNEEKNLFFRKNFYLGKYCCFYGRKPHIYKGKKIYFENIPTINQIDWKEIKYSTEKIYAANSFRQIFSILIYFVFSSSLFYGTIKFSQLTTIEIFKYNILKFPFVRAFMLIIVNIIFEKIIIICLSVFHFSDLYFKEITVRYIVMQKTFLNTVIINILQYQRKLSMDIESQYVSFIYFIILLVIKNIFFTRFSETYLIQKLKFFIKTVVLRKKLLQSEINELYSDNFFLVIRIFEKYRILVYTSLFLVRLFPLWGIFLIICVFIHYIVIKWSLFNSSLKDINYYGYYFNLLMKIEFPNLILIVVILSISSNYPGSLIIQNKEIFPNYLGSLFDYTTEIVFFFVSDINNLINLRTNFNIYTTDKNYSEMQAKFKRKFNDEKFVDLCLLKKQLKLE